ncbi:hypothetical protein CR513_04955, partial [Mucuna pruriens]
MNSTWKPMGILGSTNPEKIISSRLESTPIQFMPQAHCRWDEPFVITNIFPYGAVELKDEHTNNTFQVNVHQIKLFHEGPTPTTSDLETISLMELALPVWGSTRERSKHSDAKGYRRRGQSKYGNTSACGVECKYKPKHLRDRENICLSESSVTFGHTFMVAAELISVKESRLSQPTPSRPTDSMVQQPMRKQPSSPIRSGPIMSSTSVIQHRGHLSSNSTAMSLLENLPRHSEESVQGKYKSETDKPKIVRRDCLDYQRTLVDLILNVLANGGEPSSFDHGDRRGRRIHSIHTLFSKSDMESELELRWPLCWIAEVDDAIGPFLIGLFPHKQTESTFLHSETETFKQSMKINSSVPHANLEMRPGSRVGYKRESEFSNHREERSNEGHSLLRDIRIYFPIKLEKSIFQRDEIGPNLVEMESKSEWTRLGQPFI